MAPRLKSVVCSERRAAFLDQRHPISWVGKPQRCSASKVLNSKVVDVHTSPSCMMVFIGPGISATWNSVTVPLG